MCSLQPSAIAFWSMWSTLEEIPYSGYYFLSELCSIVRLPVRRQSTPHDSLFKRVPNVCSKDECQVDKFYFHQLYYHPHNHYCHCHNVMMICINIIISFIFNIMDIIIIQIHSGPLSDIFKSRQNTMATWPAGSLFPCVGTASNQGILECYKCCNNSRYITL